MLPLRPFIMRPDSELLIFIFRPEKRMGLLMRSDFAKYDGIKSDLRIRWPKSSDFGPKSDDSTHRIIRSKNGIDLYSSKNLTEQSRPGTAAVRGTHKSASNDRCVGLNTNTTTMRERSRRASPQRDYSHSCRSMRAWT